MAQSLKSEHSIPRVLWRWSVGKPLDGRDRTNATFFRPADQVLTRGGRASAWSRLPGWKRAAWRHGTVGVLASGAAGYAMAPEAAAGTAGALGTAMTAWGAHKATRAVLVYRHRRDFVMPLARILGPTLYGEATPTPGWLTVPLDVHDEGEVRVELPGYLGKDQRGVVLEIVRLKLGMTTDVTAEWRYKGRNNHLSVKRLPAPPKKVGFADAEEAMLNAPESAPVLGFGRRNKVVAVDFDSESPHVLISAAPGGGKSVLTRAILAQLMRHGAQGVVLDVKRQSHRWARNLPGVRYCKEAAEIHNALIEIAAEGDRRNCATDDIPDDVDTTALDVGPRIVIVAEEMNATMNRLQAYWMSIREKGDPKPSPAVKAFADILFMGRSTKIHVIAIAQMMTAKALGGPEARENFSTRIMSRYTVNAWRMLAPEIWPAPKSTRHPGRVQVVIGGEAHETQALFLTDKEAAAWATAGPVTVPVEWSKGACNAATLNVATPSDQGVALENVAPMSLTEIADRSIVPLTAGSLRSAKSRGGGFPVPVVRRGERDLYRPADIVAWHASRTPSRPAANLIESVVGGVAGD